MRRTSFKVPILFILLCAIAIHPAVVLAQSSSTNYQVNETFFGTGGEVETSSSSYKTQGASAGALGVGQTSSNTYDGFGGFITPYEIYLSMVTSGATVNLGDLSETATSSGAAQAGACNCSFTVRTYLSSGYVVITMSDPPTNESGGELNAKTVLGVPSSSQSVEEFGINLVDNTSPNIGANLSNQPDNTFADGEIASGYDTPDQFKYNKGDVIASSAATPTNPAIGETNYTISYIAKKSSITEAGSYRMNHDIVVVATF